MDNSILSLFKEIAIAAESAAEQVKEYDNKKNDSAGAQSAEKMRQDYSELIEKLQLNTSLTRQNYIQLLLGSMIVTNNLETRLELLQKTIKNYKTMIIPKLQRIMNETTEDDEAHKLAEKLFEENKN